jgi:hypothetical protein
LRAWAHALADRRGRRIGVVPLARRLSRILFAMNIEARGNVIHASKICPAVMNDWKSEWRSAIERAGVARTTTAPKLTRR